MLASFATLALWLSTASGALTALPVPLVDLDLEALNGLWFRTHTSIVADTAMPDRHCGVAYLALTGKDTFYLETASNVGSPEGPLEVGYNTMTKRKDSAVFDNKQAKCMHDCQMPEFLTAMSVIAVSEIDADTGMYHWMVCSDPQGMGLMVCARDPATFLGYKAGAVLAQAQQLGLDSCLTAPIPVHHGADCAYGFPHPTVQPTSVPTTEGRPLTKPPSRRTRKPQQVKTRRPREELSVSFDFFEDGEE